MKQIGTYNCSGIGCLFLQQLCLSPILSENSEQFTLVMLFTVIQITELEQKSRSQKNRKMGALFVLLVEVQAVY